MKIKSFQGGYDKNFSYLVWCSNTKHAAIIDPSVEPSQIIEYIEQNDLILSKVLITHTHHDHIAFLDDFLNYFSNLLVYCYHKPINIKNRFIGLVDNETIIIGNKLFIAIHTPGHFEDSMCFWNNHDKMIFTGDTVFVGRTGRVISHKSNINDLYLSVYNKILKLPHQTMIYPGHHYGYTSTISIRDNIKLFDFFSCKNFEEFSLIMQNFEKNR